MQGRGQVQGRDAEGGAELDHRSRLATARQHVQQRAGVPRYRQREVFQAAIKIQVLGLAAHQAFEVFMRKVGELGAVHWRLFGGGVEQAFQQRRNRRCGEGVHSLSPD